MDWKELSGQIPESDIIRALDDDGDGAADESAWAKVQADAEERIAGALGGKPEEKYADVAKLARKLFLLETLFTRRWAGEKNPFTGRAADAEKRLRALASGEESQSGNAEPLIIGTPSKLAGFGGLLG